MSVGIHICICAYVHMHMCIYVHMWYEPTGEHALKAMECWGWRLPFLLALLPGLSAALGRRWLRVKWMLDAWGGGEGRKDALFTAHTHRGPKT